MFGFLNKKRLAGATMVLAALLLWCLAAVGSVAAAADLADKRYTQAASYYNNSRGVSFKELERSQWQECLRLFQKAHDTNPNHQKVAPKALYMMATIYGKAARISRLRPPIMNS